MAKMAGHCSGQPTRLRGSVLSSLLILEAFEKCVQVKPAVSYPTPQTRASGFTAHGFSEYNFVPVPISL